MIRQKYLRIDELGPSGVSPQALMETRQVEQPWAELAAWLRRMHAMAKSELNLPDAKDHE